MKMILHWAFCLTVYAMFYTVETNGFLMHGNPNSSTGHNTEMKEVMQILQNQSTELENLKQKSENDTFQIKLLQELIHNMTANGGNDKNVTERLDIVDKHLNDLNVQFRYTSLSLLDIQTMAEEMNGSMLQLIEEINGHDRSTIKLLLDQSNELETLKREAENDRSTIKLLLNKSNDLENLKGEVENDRSTLNLLLNQSNELESLKQKVEKDTVNINSLLTQSKDFIQNMTINREMDKNVTKRLNALDKHLNDLKVQFRYISLSLLDVQAMAEEINGSLIQPLEEKIGPLIANPKQKVAFTAGVTSYSSTWSSGTLVFNSVLLNVGNGYNPNTGVFTSPVAGTYVFYVTTVEYSTQYLRVDIVLNSVSKVRTMGESNAAYQTGTNMVVLNLQKGDTVWVKHNSGTGYWSMSVPATTFTGFLIGHS